MSNNPNHVPALVLGLSPTGLLIMRSLGRKGITVYGADFTSWGLARPSRYCVHAPELTLASQQNDGKVLADAMVDFAWRLNLPAGEKPVLYVTSDAYIEILCPHYAQLEPHFRFSTHLDDIAARMLDKRTFYGLCDLHHVDMPRTYFQQDVDDIERIAHEMIYPAIIKPAYIHHLVQELGGNKVLEVDGPDAMIPAYRKLAEVDDGLVVQEVIPGGDDHIIIAACYIGDTHEEVFVGKKLRQFKPRFGSASLALSEWDDHVAKTSVAFLRAVGFRGLCGVEFKRDARDGSLKMIEVNVRATLWMGLTSAAGVDLPYIAYCDLLGVPHAPSKQRDGVKWTFLPRDMQSALYYVQTGELTLSDWAASVRGCRHEAIVSRDDLLPAAFIPLYAVARAVQKRFGSSDD